MTNVTPFCRKAKYTTPAQAERAGRKVRRLLLPEPRDAWIDSVYEIAATKGFHIVGYAEMQDSAAPEDSWADWHDALFLVRGDGWDDVLPFVFLDEIETLLLTEFNEDE